MWWFIILLIVIFVFSLTMIIRQEKSKWIKKLRILWMVLLVLSFLTLFINFAIMGMFMNL